MPDGPRYDDDFFAWTQHQATVLREMPVTDNRFDREHVAEEIEDLGKSERDADQVLDRLYADGRKRAADSLRRFGEPAAADALPQACPYSLDDICREDWYPDRPGARR